MHTSDYKDTGFFFMNEYNTIFLSHEEILALSPFLSKKGFKRFDKEFDHFVVKQNLPFQELIRILKFRTNFTLPIQCYNKSISDFIAHERVLLKDSLSAAAFSRVLELQESPFTKIQTESRLNLIDSNFFKPKDKKDIVISEKKLTEHITVNPILFEDWVLLLKKAKSLKTLNPIILKLKECFTID